MVLGNPGAVAGDAQEFYFEVTWSLGVFLKSSRMQSGSRVALWQHFRLPCL